MPAYLAQALISVSGNVGDRFVNGSNIIEIYVDSNQVVTESNENNNMVRETINIEEELPDLVVEDITYELNWNNTGRDSIVAKICNIGSADMPGNENSTVRGNFTLNGTHITYSLWTAPYFEKGECVYSASDYSHFSRVDPSSSINVAFETDDFGQVHESNENNNILRKVINISSGGSGHSMPDLVIDDVAFVPSNPVKGEQFSGQYRMTISNIGDQSVGRFKYNVYLKNPINKTIYYLAGPVGGLEAGDSKTFLTSRFTTTKIFVREVTIKANVDQNNNVEESNEENNYFEKIFSTVQVEEPELQISDISAGNITDTRAVIRFKTNYFVESRVTYGTEDTPDGRNFVAYNYSLDNSHAILLYNLLPNTTYYYRITAGGGGYDSVESLSYSFKTLSGDTFLQGSLLKLPDSDMVYYLGYNNMRYAFPILTGDNHGQQVMDSWDINEDDIIEVSPATITSFPLGGNIVFRPGSKLTKIASDTQAYAVGAKGVMHRVSIDQRFDLYGVGNSYQWWNHDLVSVVPNPFFVNYTIGNDLNNNYPDGSLIKYSSDPSKVYLVFNGFKHLITKIGLSVNKLNNQPVYTAPVSVVYSDGQVINEHHSCLTDIAQLETCSFGGSSNGVGLTVAKYAGFADDQNVVKPATQAKLGSFVLTAGIDEGIVVDTINIDEAVSSVLQNMKLIGDSSGIQYGATKVTLTSDNITDNVFSIYNLNLVAGESKVINIYADTKVSSLVDEINLDVGAIGTSVITSTTVYHNTSSDGDADVDLQRIKITAGGITSSAAPTQPDADIVIAGTTAAMNAVKFTASNEAYIITKLRLDNPFAYTSGDSIGKVILVYKNKEGISVIREAYTGGDNQIDFTGLDMYVPQDDTAILTIKAVIPTIPSGADSGDLISLDYVHDAGFSAVGQSSNNLVSDSAVSDVRGNAMVVRKTKPTIHLNSLPTTVLADGTQTISKFTISADVAGSVYFGKLNWDYAATSGIDLVDGTIYIYAYNDQTVKLRNKGVSVVDNIIELTTDVEQVVSAGSSKTYLLKGTITGASASSDASLSTNLRASSPNATAATSTTLEQLDNYEKGGILWSDGSASPHYASSSDYVDANYVKYLPSDSQTLSGGGSGTTITKTSDMQEPSPVLISDSQMGERLAGKLLLATEDKGRIYYVHKEDNKKYEVTFGNLTNLFEDLALGISDVDLNAIPINPESVSDEVDSDGDGYTDKEEVINDYNPHVPSDPNNIGNDKMVFIEELADKLKGRILIQVDSSGQIWFMDQEGKRWQVTWENAMNLFNNLALGIIDQDLLKMSDGN